MYEFIVLGMIIGLFFLRSQINKQAKRIDLLEKHLQLDRSAMPTQAMPAQTLQMADDLKISEPVSPWKLAATAPPAPTQPAFSQAEAPVEAPVSADPPKAFVFKEKTYSALSGWLKDNWFYGIAAVSLALAAVFLVQYGVENGLLTPFWRVISTFALGAALIAAGEWVRRKVGDDAASHTAYLPSTFSGAGVVALFVGVLSARQLYGLIGPETAFAGLVLVSVVSIVLGWFYGPLLTVVGILGATMSPFLVGGSGGSPELYFYFFALIAIVGLLIDTVKHWAWPSVMALISTYLAAIYIFGFGLGDLHLLAFGLIVAAAAATIPLRKLWPDHEGRMVTQALIGAAKAGGGWPEFPTRVAFGSFAATGLAALLVVLADHGEAQVFWALMAMALLFLAAVIWFIKAPALSDLAAVPPILVLIGIIAQATNYGSLYQAFITGGGHGFLVMLVAMAAAGSCLAFWRARRPGPHGVVWAGGAALIAPLTVATLEGFWQPAMVIGAGQWAIFVMAVAAMMTVMAERIARTDGENHMRAAFFATAALIMISLSLMLLLSSVALTVMLAVVVLLAAQLDLKFDLGLLAIFVQIGVAVASWRLVVDPGISWAVEAPILQVLLAFGAVIALLTAAWITLKTRGRRGAILATESAVWSLSAIVAVVVIYRIFEEDFFTFWGLSLTALVWLISAGVQGYRLQSGSGMIRIVRLALGAIYTLIGGAILGIATTVLNPLFYGTPILGPYVFDTLLVAYGLPAVLFAVMARKFAHVAGWLRQFLAVLSAGYAALYLGLEVRRFWRGDDLSVPGTTGPELYTYTVVMLVAAVGLLFYAFSRRSKLLYRVAIIGVGLTIAKVFLVDTSGLSGLIRVASFLGLGLALSGLAWANGQMKRQWEDGGPKG